MTRFENGYIENQHYCEIAVPLPNKAAWLEALAKLEAEFVAFQKQVGSPAECNLTAVTSAAKATPRAFPGGIESGGFPSALAWANLKRIDSPGS